MRTIKYFFLPVFCFLILQGLTAQEYAPDRLLVQFLEGEEPAMQGNQFNVPAMDKLNAEYRLMHARQLVPNAGSHGLHRVYVLRFEDAIDMEDAIHDYWSLGIFSAVEPDFKGYGAGECEELTPNDTYYDRQWGLYNDGTFSLDDATVDADIDMDEAWDVASGDPNLIVAILDSGFKEDHPELSGRIWTNSGEIEGNSIDDDANGYVDDDWGWDFAFNDESPADGHGHGTNVAGIATATGNNGIGYAGVDWDCQVMILKILDDNNSGFYSWWAEAITYAVDHGASVMNMSVGGSSTSTILEAAVNYARDNDVVIVACMMNYNNSVPYYPAAFDHTIAVGSTDADDTRTEPFFWSNTSGSNYGSHIDVCAPGNFIYGLSYNSNTNFNTYWGGTSQATPLVAGLCALLRAQDPSLTSEDLRTILRSTAEDQVGDPSEDTPGWDQYHGAGRVNAYEALTTGVSNIQEIENYASLGLHPNPVSRYANSILVQFDAHYSGDIQWSLRTMDGRQIAIGETFLNGAYWDFSVPAGLDRGMYLLETRIGSKVFTGKMIVN